MKREDLLNALAHRCMHIMGDGESNIQNYLHRRITEATFVKRMRKLAISMEIVYREIDDLLIKRKANRR